MIELYEYSGLHRNQMYFYIIFITRLELKVYESQRRRKHIEIRMTKMLINELFYLFHEDELNEWGFAACIVCSLRSFFLYKRT